MAPHIARMMGFGTMPHIVMSALTGLLLVFADWCGRMMMFPSDPGGAAVDLYRRAVLYLFAEKAESVTVSLFPGGLKRYRGCPGWWRTPYQR
jgi:iron complex transport system permease protein